MVSTILKHISQVNGFRMTSHILWEIKTNVPNHHPVLMIQPPLICMIQVAWRPSDGRIPLQAAGANLRDATKVRRPEVYGGTYDGDLWWFCRGW